MQHSSGNFDSRLADLLARLSTLPPEQQEKLRPLVEATHARQVALDADVAAAHDALADWRIVTKYALFANEAAARERKH